MESEDIRAKYEKLAEFLNDNDFIQDEEGDISLAEKSLPAANRRIVFTGSEWAILG